MRLDYIPQISKFDNNGEIILSNIIKDYSERTIRYDEYTSFLRFIILQQTNAHKNRHKGKFENYSYDQLICLILEEVYELKEELENPKSLNKIRILEEIGDIGAFLVGFIAKIMEKIPDAQCIKKTL